MTIRLSGQSAAFLGRYTRSPRSVLYGFALTSILIGATFPGLGQFPMSAIGSSSLNCGVNRSVAIPSDCNADINPFADAIARPSALMWVPTRTPDTFGPEIALPTRFTVHPACCTATSMRSVIAAISWASPMIITSTRCGPSSRRREAILACCAGLRDRGALNRANSRLASAARASACCADSFAFAISARNPSALALASADAFCASATFATASFDAASADAICASAVFTRASESAILLSNCLAVAVASATPRCASAILRSCALDTASFNWSFRLPAIMTNAVKRKPNSRLAAIPQLATVIASDNRSTDFHRSWRNVIIFGHLREDYLLLISSIVMAIMAFVLGYSIKRNK